MDSTSPQSKPDIPNYELHRRIGRGAYGEVWLGRSVIGAWHAVKIVYRDPFPDDRRFQSAFKGIQRYEPISRSHPNLVPILNVGLGEGYFFYVMELADDASGIAEAGTQELAPGSPGETSESGQEGSNIRNPASRIQIPDSYVPKTLQCELKQRGALPVERCIEIAVGLTAGLEHLHKYDLVHRDLKPSNVIFVNGLPKLADIDLVTDVDATRSFVGTEGYVPREGPGAPPADLFALGKVLYEISTGLDRLSYPDVPHGWGTRPDHEDWTEFNQVVVRACEANVKDRYQTAGKLRSELLRLRGGRSLRRTRQLEKRWKQARWVIAGLVVLGGAGLTLQYFQVRAQRRGVLIQQAQQWCLKTPHMEGWSSNAWAKLVEAQGIGSEAGLRDQFAVTLSGLDAHEYFDATVAGSSVAFDASGEHLLTGGYTNGPALWRMDSPPHVSTNAAGGNAAATQGARTFLSARTAGEIPRADENVRAPDLAKDHAQIARSSDRPLRGPVAFLPDGTPVQLSHDGTDSLVLWDVKKDRAIAHFKSPATLELPRLGDTPILALAADGSHVAAAAQFGDRMPVVLAWQSGQEMPRFQFTNEAAALAFSPTGALLAMGGYEGEIRVWSLATGDTLITLTNEPTAVNCLAFRRDPHREPGRNSPEDGWLLAAGSAGGAVTIWDLGRRMPRSFCHGSAYNAYALAFNPDGTLLASAGRIDTRLWDVATGQLVLVIPGLDNAKGLAFSPDGTRLAGVTEPMWAPGYVSLWDLEQGRGIRLFRGLSGPVSRVCFSRNGQWAAAVAHNWQAGIWDVQSGRLWRVFDVPQGFVADNAALAFNADGSLFAFSAGREAKVWEVGTGRERRKWSLPPGLVDRIAFTESNKFVLFRQEPKDTNSIVHRNGEEIPYPRACRVRELSLIGAARELFEITNFNGRVMSAVVPPDGKVVVVQALASREDEESNVVMAYEVPTGRRVWSHEPAGGDELVVDPSGALVGFALTPRARISHAFETSSGKDIGQLPKHTMALHPNGKLSAGKVPRADSSVGPALFARGKDSALVMIGLEPPGNSFFPLFSPDGKYLAWGGTDGTLLMADIAEIRQRLATVDLDW